MSPCLSSSLRRLRACSQSASRRYQSWCCCTCSPVRAWSPRCFTLWTERRQPSQTTGTIQVTNTPCQASSGLFLFSILCQTLTHFLRSVDGEDEKPPLPPRSASTSTPPGPETPTERYKVCVTDHLVLSRSQSPSVTKHKQLAKTPAPTNLSKHCHVFNIHT